MHGDWCDGFFFRIEDFVKEDAMKTYEVTGNYLGVIVDLSQYDLLKGGPDGDRVQVEQALLRVPQGGEDRPGEEWGRDCPAVPGAHV